MGVGGKKLESEKVLIMLKWIDEVKVRILLGAVVQNLAEHPKALPRIFGGFSLTKHSQVHLSRFISFGSYPMREQKGKKQICLMQGSPSKVANTENTE